MKNIKTIIIVLSVFLPGLLYAQDSTLLHLPANWTLEECIAYAKKNNIQINNLRLNTSSAEQDLEQSRAAVLPNLSGSVTQTIVNGKSPNAVTGAYQPNTNFSSGYGLNSA